MPSLVVLRSTGVNNTKFFLLLSSRSVWRGFSFVDSIPCILVCRCPIVVFLDFSICLLMSFLVRPGHVFRNPCLMSFVRISVVRLNIDVCKYRASSVFDVCTRMLFITDYGCWVSRRTSQIPFFLLLVPLIISFPLLWTYISFLYSVMVHSSSH